MEEEKIEKVEADSTKGEERTQIREADSILEDENVCKNCGKAEVVEGYTIPLCSDCRKHYANHPIPVWIKIMSVAILALMVAVLIQFPKALKAGIAFERGERAATAKKYSTAAKEYKKVTEIYPKSFISKGKLFIAYVKNAQIDAAADVFEQIKSTKSKDSDEVEVIKEANEAIKTLDSYYDIKKDLADIMKQEKTDGLQTTLNKLLEYTKKNPKEYYGFFYLGDIYFDLGKYQEAKLAYLKSVELKPTIFFTHLGAAAAYRMTGEFDKAIDECNKVLEDDLESSDAYASLSKIELKRHQYKTALEYAQTAYLYDENNMTTLETIALAYHFNNMAKERDEIIDILKSMEDPNLSNVQAIIDGKSKLYE